MKKESPFISYIKKVVKKFKKSRPKTIQDASQILFAQMLNYKSHQTHGGLCVTGKSWRRLKALQQRAKYLRGSNSRDRTSGGKS